MRHIEIRCILGWIAMIIGAILGWYIAEFAWQMAHPQGLRIHGLPLSRGLDYWLSAPCCSLAGAALGLVLVRWRDLPDGEVDAA
jgi:TRAP-type C4-dicarboxylate transport system permease small subunit